MNPGITYQVEFSGNATTWTTNASLIDTTSIDPIWERVRYQDTVTMDQAQSRFCRVKVIQ